MLGDDDLRRREGLEFIVREGDGLLVGRHEVREIVVELREEGALAEEDFEVDHVEGDRRCFLVDILVLDEDVLVINPELEELLELDDLVRGLARLQRAVLLLSGVLLE